MKWQYLTLIIFWISYTGFYGFNWIPETKGEEFLDRATVTVFILLIVWDIFK